ncbi:MAG: quinone-dependent dihydroorotate dehydrogenase [Fimbriimonadaceae bacterium]
MNDLWPIARKILFRLDPEAAHHLAFCWMERGWFLPNRATTNRFRKELMGMEFANPVGLAAGFDKDGRLAHVWHRFGFGFAELGTVTPRPQPGNPKPRMFRLPEVEGLINRLGFNNEGAEALAQRLRQNPPQTTIGLNVGKNKETPAENAASDYLAGFRALQGIAGYGVVNVSSPNTPGLRDLQDDRFLTDLLARLRRESPGRPFLVKVSPDMDSDQLDRVVRAGHEGGAAGFVVSNTTIRRDVLPPSYQQSALANEAGGLSGTPLFDLANQALVEVKKRSNSEMVIIASGGVTSTGAFLKKLELGADLVQVYTGFVYGGPTFVFELLDALGRSLQPEAAS